MRWARPVPLTRLLPPLPSGLTLVRLGRDGAAAPLPPPPSPSSFTAIFYGGTQDPPVAPSPSAAVVRAEAFGAGEADGARWTSGVAVSLADPDVTLEPFSCPQRAIPALADWAGTVTRQDTSFVIWLHPSLPPRDALALKRRLGALLPGALCVAASAASPPGRHARVHEGRRSVSASGSSSSSSGSGSSDEGETSSAWDPPPAVPEPTPPCDALGLLDAAGRHHPHNVIIGVAVHGLKAACAASGRDECALLAGLARGLVGDVSWNAATAVGLDLPQQLAVALFGEALVTGRGAPAAPAWMALPAELPPLIAGGGSGGAATTLPALPHLPLHDARALLLPGQTLTLDAASPATKELLLYATTHTNGYFLVGSRRSQGGGGGMPLPVRPLEALAPGRWWSPSESGCDDSNSIKMSAPPSSGPGSKAWVTLTLAKLAWLSPPPPASHSALPQDLPAALLTTAAPTATAHAVGQVYIQLAEGGTPSVSHGATAFTVPGRFGLELVGPMPCLESGGSAGEGGDAAEQASKDAHGPEVLYVSAEAGWEPAAAPDSAAAAAAPDAGWDALVAAARALAAAWPQVSPLGRYVQTQVEAWCGAALVRLPLPLLALADPAAPPPARPRLAAAAALFAWRLATVLPMRERDRLRIYNTPSLAERLVLLELVLERLQASSGASPSAPLPLQ